MYRLFLGDAKDTVSKFDDESIDVLISDIPYGVKINSNWDNAVPSNDIWNECYRVLKPGSYCIIFGQPSMVCDIIKVMSSTKFEYRDMWVWHYQGTHTKGIKLETPEGLFRSRIRNVFNPIYVFRKQIEISELHNWRKYHTNLLNIDVVREPYKGNHTSIMDKYNKTGKKHYQSEKKSNTFKTMGRKGWVPDSRGREPVNLQYFPRATSKEKTIDGLVKNKHETVKPIKLMMWLINLTTSYEKQVVLDPFCGTGSTGCACKLLNRGFIGIDNDPDSIKVAKARLDGINNIRGMFL